MKKSKIYNNLKPIKGYYDYMKESKIYIKRFNSYDPKNDDRVLENRS